MLNKIANERLVEDICKNIGVAEKYMDDFVQEMYLILLEYDQNKLQEIYDKGQLNFFLTRIIKNQWCSKTSTFYRTYRKYYNLIDGNNDGYNMYEEIDDRGCAEDD
jgi:hypothetical protein